MNRKQLLERAISCTCGDRNSSYGPPEINMQCAAELKAVYAKYAVWDGPTAHHNAIDLTLDKIARVACGEANYHEDNYVDGSAYLAIAGECHPGNPTNAWDGDEAVQGFVDNFRRALVLPLIGEDEAELGNTIKTAPGAPWNAKLVPGTVVADNPEPAPVNAANAAGAVAPPITQPPATPAADTAPVSANGPSFQSGREQQYQKLKGIIENKLHVRCCDCIFGQVIREKDRMCQANLRASVDPQAFRDCFKYRAAEA